MKLFFWHRLNFDIDLKILLSTLKFCLRRHPCEHGFTHSGMRDHPYLSIVWSSSHWCTIMPDRSILIHHIQITNTRSVDDNCHTQFIFAQVQNESRMSHLLNGFAHHEVWLVIGANHIHMCTFSFPVRWNTNQVFNIWSWTWNVRAQFHLCTCEIGFVGLSPATGLYEQETQKSWCLQMLVGKCKPWNLLW